MAHRDALSAVRREPSERRAITPALNRLPDRRPLNRERLGELFAAASPRLTAVALRITRSRDVAEDVVQCAFEKALRGANEFRGDAMLTTWLHRIVVNEALMWLRSERRRRARIADEAEVEPRSDPSPSPAERLLSGEATARVREGLGRLGPQDREVLIACHLEGVSYRQYGLRAGLHPAAAKSRAFRARRALRSELRALS